MNRKLVLVITLISVLLFSAMVGVRFVTFVAANPIAPSGLVMPKEYINVTISLVDRNLLAKVNGTYLFYSAGYETVRTDYPLPPNTTNISIKMNETWLDWTYNTKTYPTVIGDWPMINWTISPVPDHFIIKTYYEHPIPATDGNYTFLYALGTGKYLKTPIWETTAYIDIRMEINYTNLHVYTIGVMNETWTWNPMSYAITRENTTEIITLKVVSQRFTPLKEDLLITFTYQMAPEFTSQTVPPPFIIATILPLSMIATLLVVIAYRRKDSKKYRSTLKQSKNKLN